MNEINIEQLSKVDLIELNRRIVERLKWLHQIQAQGTMKKFQIGERVMFHPKNRPTVRGKLTRYNKKSVTVISDEGHRCNVSPELLKKVADC
jgi:hypothetical protein